MSEANSYLQIPTKQHYRAGCWLVFASNGSDSLVLQAVEAASGLTVCSKPLQPVNWFRGIQAGKYLAEDTGRNVWLNL